MSKRSLVTLAAALSLGSCVDGSGPLLIEQKVNCATVLALSLLARLLLAAAPLFRERLRS